MVRFAYQIAREGVACTRFRRHRCLLEQEAVVERRRFTSEFKVEAVKLVRERGLRQGGGTRSERSRERSAEVGQVVRRRSDAFFPGHGQMKPEQQEIEGLRREVQKLKAERDIVKTKADAYFAKEST